LLSSICVFLRPLVYPSN